MAAKRFTLWSMLEIIDTTISYAGKRLFRPVNLSIGAGEFCVLSAPSGAGKSSLLRWIAGITPASMTGTGMVKLNGVRIDEKKPQDRRVGFMFQMPFLFPHLTVRENLGFGLEPTLIGSERRVVIMDALSHAGLEDLAERDPETLSGGQQARVSLLRTLLAQPQALLLDEPFSSLDDEARTQIVDFVLGEVKRLALPVLLVSHDPRDSALSTHEPAKLVKAK